MSQTVLFFLTAPVVESFSSEKNNNNNNNKTKLLNYCKEESHLLRLKQHHSMKLRLVKRNIYIICIINCALRNKDEKCDGQIWIFCYS